MCALDQESLIYASQISRLARQHQISNEVYPGAVKIKKQLDYANAKGFKYAAIIGQTERETQTISLKNLFEGTQKNIHFNELINALTNE